MEFNFEKYLLKNGYEKIVENRVQTIFRKDSTTLHTIYRDGDINCTLDLGSIYFDCFYIPIPTSEEAANVLILELIPRAVGCLTTLKKEFDKLK